MRYTVCLSRRPVLLGLLVLLMLMSSTSLAETSKPQQVWLLAGQSNMIGYGTSTAALPPELRRPQTNVKAFTNVGTGWIDLAPGLGPNNAMFGPELTFGRDMAAASPEIDILLIKARFGLGDLYNDWRSSNTGRGPAGKHYARFISLQKAAMALKPDAKITGIIWMQGEADAYDDLNEATSYENNLKLFIKNLRTDLKSPHMRFVIGQINESEQWVHGEIVRRAQAEVVRTIPNCVLVTTKDLPLCDGMHFTSQGSMRLGSRFARKAITTIDLKGN